MCEHRYYYQGYRTFGDNIPGYAQGLVIDRIDNDSGYSPENCRFVDRKQSSRNRRNTLFVAGKSTGEWAEISGMDTKRVKDLALKLGEREFVERMNANPRLSPKGTRERRAEGVREHSVQRKRHGTEKENSRSAPAGHAYRVQGLRQRPEVQEQAIRSGRNV